MKMYMFIPCSGCVFLKGKCTGECTENKWLSSLKSPVGKTLDHKFQLECVERFKSVMLAMSKDSKLLPGIYV